MTINLSKELEFLTSKPRLKSLFILLFRAENYVTSQELAERLDVTSRTIKSDITELRTMIEKIGVIESKRSLGYKLFINKNEYREKIKIMFQIYPSSKVENEFDYYVLYILRRLVSSPIPIKVEELQRELLTTSSLNKEFADVREMLAKYDLSLAVRPHHGMCIEGPFFKKIMLTIRIYRYFSEESLDTFVVEDYQQLFQCSPSEKNEIKQTFLKVITKTRIVFSDIDVERFVIYLIYFRNYLSAHKELQLDLPKIDFDYENTEEYKLVREFIQVLRNKFTGFDFIQEITQFLTYVSIFSTDLYRFVDCNEKNYHQLIPLAEEARNFLMNQLSNYLKIDVFEDYTCFKDLLKMMIPISLKIKLNVSDSIDFRYKDFTSDGGQPILRFYVNKLAIGFYKKYRYEFSKRELHIIFLIFYGLLNRITLEHRKLRIAIIAIDGRLSTQQLKFNLLHYFSDYIERIETRALYELNVAKDLYFDYYLCTNFGKNLDIKQAPVYYVEEEVSEVDYLESLRKIFVKTSSLYGEKLPPIQLLNKKSFGKEKQVLTNKDDFIEISSEVKVKMFLNFSADDEKFIIWESELDEYTVIVHLKLGDDKQILKMILKILNRIMIEPELLSRLSVNHSITYADFLL